MNGEKIVTCTAIDCEKLKNTTDKYFCEEHRKEWKELCLSYGISNDIKEEKIMSILKDFQEGKTKRRSDLNEK